MACSWISRPLAVIAALLAAAAATAQTSAPASQPTTQPARELYVVATAHLDTQWLWTIQTTINEYIPATLRDNFRHFEKFPNYIFSFEGAFRYMLAREYYPEDFAKLKEYIARGRWRVCGSSVDAGDVNLPAPEALIRHVLYGNGFFQREFGVRSRDIYLPDCFGFGYSLPTIAAHCGLKGFSTQKLTWGSSVGIPFDIGVWQGVDGSRIVAALNPGDYVSRIGADLSRDEERLARIDKLGAASGLYAGYKYFGVGDTGGAPDYASVAWLEKSIKADGPIRVVNTGADQLARDVTPEQLDRLPVYNGELLMRIHGTGCYTSMAAMKRWNRQNELLADAAERAAVAADWLGAAPWPGEKLTAAWIRVLWHHHHDDLTGTSIPEAYTFSWNDEVLSLNQFAEVLTDSVGAVARGMDTLVDGVPLVVFNPLSIARSDVVEAILPHGDASPSWCVYGPDGERVPCQIEASPTGPKGMRALFLADVPPLSFSVFTLGMRKSPHEPFSKMQATERSLANGLYTVQIDDNGDISSIRQEVDGAELLAAPLRLQLLKDTPEYWDEWEVRYEDLAAEPYGYVGGPITTRVIERGPVRVALEIERKAGDSRIVQTVRLTAGSERIDIESRVDWRTPNTLLKAVFPLRVANARATYDLGIGTIDRGNNRKELYEVPAQQWVDLSAPDYAEGVTLMSDCKYGWDKPADNTLRLSLIHTPKKVQKDMGRHVFTYALAGHMGESRGIAKERNAFSVWQAARFNQPLRAFTTAPHPGSLGRMFSFANVNTPDVAIQALKKAEGGDEIVVRLVEKTGQPAANVLVAFAAPIVAAREINGQEEPLGPAELRGGQLATSLRAFQPRAFAVKLAPPSQRLDPPRSQPVALPYDADVVSLDDNRADGDFGDGHSLPGELLPATLVCEGVTFKTGPATAGQKNAVICRGQKIDLPAGDFNRVYVLAAAVGGDEPGDFQIAGRPEKRIVQEYTGNIGQSDSLVVGDIIVDHKQMAAAYIKRAPVAWVGTHRHTADGRNEPYIFCYLFKFGFDLQPGERTLTLPDNDRIRVLAISVARNDNDATQPAGDLYDRIRAPRITPPGGLYTEPLRVTLAADSPDADIRYTLDDTDPVESSPRFSAPVRIDKSATLRAAVREADGRFAEVARGTFTVAPPRPADQAAKVVPGLDYKLYKGQWRAMPNWGELTPVAAGVLETVGLKTIDAQEKFGLELRGYLRAPVDGVYMLYLNSDDGSMLHVGDQVVVDNDGPHSPRERAAPIALQAGLHRLRIGFFQGGGPCSLDLSWRKPGELKQAVPADALFREAPAD